MTRRDYDGRYVVLAVVLVLFVLPAAAVTYDLANSTPTSGTIPIETQTGTTVYVTNTGGEMNLQDPWVANNELRIATGPNAGNATIISDGPGNLTLDQTAGAETQISAIDANNSEIYINPEDKAPANFTGGIETFNYSGAGTLDDGNADFTYSATGNQPEIVINGVPADSSVRAVAAGTSDNVGGGQSDASGTVRLTGMETVTTTDVELQSSSGGPGLSDPSPQGTQSSFPNEMSVSVSDPDFNNGENVTVEFYIDGNLQGTNTTESAGEVTLDISQPSRGNHTARAVVTDSTGNTNELNWEFAVPESIFVNRLQDPNTRIDDRQVNITFYEDGDVFQRSTPNGEISLDGLPVEGDIIASASAESTSGPTVPDRSYHDNEIIVEEISVPQTIYLLDTNATTVETRFTLQDRTSNFDGNGAQLIIQFVDNSTGTPQYEAYTGDEFGPDGVTTTLVEGARYRLLVRNEDNDERIVGQYDADVSETVPLTIGSVNAEPTDQDLAYAYNATLVNNSQSSYIRWEYNDTANDTSQVTIEIHERGNRSNKLVDNQTFSGPLGTFVITETIPTAQEGSDWVVRATVQRNGETIDIVSPVGPRSPILSDLDPWVRAVISIGSIFVVAGLFSRLNSAVGGLVVAGMGGIFFFIDFMPRETGVGVIILSMVTAAVMFIQEQRQ